MGSISVNCSRFFSLTNRGWDYIPLASTVTNLVTLFKKNAYQSRNDQKPILKNHEYAYINRKSYLRCIFLLVPVLGNLCVIIYDIIAQAFSHRKLMMRQEEIGDPSSEFRKNEIVKISTERRILPQAGILLDFTDTDENTMKSKEDRRNGSNHVQDSTDSLYAIFEGYLGERTRRDNSFSLMNSFNPYSAVFKRKAENLYSLVTQEMFDAVQTFYETCKMREIDLFRPMHNGFISISSDPGNMKYQRLIDLEKIVDRPEAFTGLLGLETGVFEPIPNWMFTIHLMKLILLRINSVQKIQNREGVALLTEDLPRNQLLHICQGMAVHYKKLHILLEEIEPSILRLIEPRNIFLKSIERNIAINSARVNQEMRDLGSYSNRHFKWENFKRNLVGKKKFFLRDQFSPQKFEAIMRPFVTKMAQRSKDSKLLWLEADRKNLEKRWIVQNDRISSPFQLLTKPRLNRVLIESGLMRKYYLDCFHSNTLVLDCAAREIQWSGYWYDNNTQEPLARIAAVVEEPESGIFVNPDGFFKPEVLRVFEAQREPALQYDASLKSLVQRYESTVNSMVQQDLISAENPLSSFNQGVIVSGMKKGDIPLVLPQALIKELENKLKQVRAASSNEFNFVPFYDFSIETGELKIIYQRNHVFLKERMDNTGFSIPGLPEDDSALIFASFTIGKFDSLTIRSFQPDLRLKSEKVPFSLEPIQLDLNSRFAKFDPSEFLLQALYGSLIDPALGLPGKGSVQLKTGWISPNEVPFPGCYRLWMEHPDRAVVYNSTTFDGSAETIQALTSENPVMVPGYLYDQTTRDIIREHKSFIGNQTEYHRVIHVLKALVSLTSSIKWETVEQRLSQIGLPERLESLFNDLSIKPVDREAIGNLQKELLQNPSEKVQELRDLAGKLQEAVKWLERCAPNHEENRLVVR